MKEAEGVGKDGQPLIQVCQRAVLSSILVFMAIRSQLGAMLAGLILCILLGCGCGGFVASPSVSPAMFFLQNDHAPIHAPVAEAPMIPKDPETWSLAKRN